MIFLVIKYYHTKRKVKLSDLFVDCFELKGMRIVKLLSHDVFFAIKTDEKGRIKICHLKKYEVESIKRKSLSIQKLDEYTWKDLEELEHFLSDKQIQVMIAVSRAQGFFENNKELEVKLNAKIERDKRKMKNKKETKNKKITAIGRTEYMEGEDR